MTTAKVKEISLSRIVARQEVQARVAMNKETIEEYAEAMRNGDKFPPVVVFCDEDSASYWLADGFHRYHAAKQIANKWALQAEIRAGGKREAILFAVGANASHGLRRSREDKRNSVLKLLKDSEWSQWSDREIARRCQVSPDTVNRIRRSLSDSDSENETRSYRTKHGTVATMNTGNIGRRRQRDKELEKNQRELEEAIENGELDLADVPVRLAGRIDCAHTSLLPRCLVLPSSHLVTVGQMQFECPMPMGDPCTCGEQPELINDFLSTWENKIQSTWNHLSRDSKRIALERLGLLVIQGSLDEEVAGEKPTDPGDEQQSIIAMVCEKNGLTEDELREKIRWLWEGPYDEQDRAEDLGITTEQLMQLEENLSGSGRPWDDVVENTAKGLPEI
jgi:transcriptional regulator with XRE-family HTH domain